MNNLDQYYQVTFRPGALGEFPRTREEFLIADALRKERSKVAENG